MGALRDPQYEKFASELAELKSPIEAYKAAGYVPHRGNATRLARRREVQSRVCELLDEAAEFANIRRVRVLVEIDRVGRANLADFFEYDVESRSLRLKNIKKLPRELTAALSAIEFDENGRPKIKLHDKNQANFALLKYLGAMPDDDETAKRQVNIFNLLNVDDQRALAEALEALPGGPAIIDQPAQGERGAGGAAP